MNPETPGGSATRLGRLGGSLTRREEFPTQVVPAPPDGAGLDTLFVALPGGEGGPEAWRMEWSFVPAPERREELPTLSGFAALCEARPETEIETLRLVNRLNTRLPLGHFALVEEAALVGYRQLLVLPDDESAAGAVLATGCRMAAYLLATFAPTLAEVAAGGRNAREALAAHPLAAAFGA